MSEPAAGPADTAGDPHQDQLIAAAGKYLDDFGWHTTVIGNQLMFDLGQGTIGVSMASSRAGEINHHLMLLDLIYPVFQIAASRNQWMFLTTCANSHRIPTLPHFVAVHKHGQRVALPPSATPRGRLDWIISPSRCGDGIPTVDVLSAVVRRMNCGW